VGARAQLINADQALASVTPIPGEPANRTEMRDMRHRPRTQNPPEQYRHIAFSIVDSGTRNRKSDSCCTLVQLLTSST